MKKFLVLSLFALLILNCAPAFAKTTHGHNSKITPKSIGAGALSLLIWPGIGQLMNDDGTEKSAVHAILGFTGVFRFWSCYDAVVDRKGGVWDNRI